MPRPPEHRDVKTARFRLMSLIHHYGLTDPRTAAAAVELAEIRADVAEAEARRLRQLANVMAVGEAVAS